MKPHLRFVLCLFATFAASAAGPAPAPWKAGVATVVITPGTNMWMAGYASRTNTSSGSFNELRAKALAIEDAGGARIVFVTLDLIGVPRSLRLGLEKRLKDTFNLPPEGLLLNASHTHSGPEFRVGRAPADDGEFKPSTLGERYGVELETKLFKLIGDALAAGAPARVGFTRARCGFAMNRRLPTPTGYANSPNPDGPVDHDVPVLRVDAADGTLRAVLFGYACHNTTLALYKFSGDYAGFAQEFIEADNPGVTALFMTGCGGDQNPYPRGTVDLAKQHGRTLATAVGAALLPKPKPLAGNLRAAFATIDIAYAPLPTRDEFTKRLDSKDRYEKQHAERMLAKLDEGGTLPATYPYPVQVVRFGNDLALVALGGEVVVDYATRLKKELGAGAASVWVAGYSNDVMAYIPSRRVREEGGYEAGGAMRFSATHPGPWALTLEERIVDTVHELNKRLLAK
ncbi:MAG: hypothetical protein FJ386_06815 [Verrucomicrobia bacterium]|nr:hypothetical protein [Verrucomicrobiota bacterium]